MLTNHPAGGTRFIGVYLARQLVEAGHSVTLLTRGKKPVTFQIPDDTDDAYARYKDAVKHIAVDRQDTPALAEALSDKAFDGVPLSGGHIAAAPPQHKRSCAPPGRWSCPVLAWPPCTAELPIRPISALSAAQLCTT